MRTKKKAVGKRSRSALPPRWVRCVAAGGITTLVGCSAPLEEEAIDLTTNEKIERSLERLDELAVFEFSEVLDTRTDNTGNCYGLPCEGRTEEQADRLQRFTDIAEQAVAGIDASDITENWNTPDGAPNLCVGGSDEMYCLTKTLHTENLERLNELQAIEVQDIIRSDQAVTGFCYSSWDSVTEDDCVRALKLDAIVELAHDEME